MTILILVVNQSTLNVSPFPTISECQYEWKCSGKCSNQQLTMPTHGVGKRGFEEVVVFG